MSSMWPVAVMKRGAAKQDDTAAAQWVAIGPCGHRSVCARCIVQVRFVSKDRRCYLCRAPCPLVVVVKGDCINGADILAELPSSPSMITRQGRVDNFWFNVDTAAYFADEQQFKVARIACVKKSFYKPKEWWRSHRRDVCRKNESYVVESDNLPRVNKCCTVVC
uniref:RING-type domain-containing protein n=1 Tax=Oryza glumipatula TaxID=40148 RepID=A0A0E0AM63_9ORYZ